MELRDMHIQLIQEMKQQGAKTVTIKSIIAKMKTISQCKQMMEYLTKTRDIPIPAGDIIMKAIQISKT